MRDYDAIRRHVYGLFDTILASGDTTEAFNLMRQWMDTVYDAHCRDAPSAEMEDLLDQCVHNMEALARSRLH